MEYEPIVDPLFVFAFLQRFVEILQDYLGDVSASSLKDNFDVVYQVNVLPSRSGIDSHVLTSFSERWSTMDILSRQNLVPFETLSFHPPL